jgi:prepilin-type N-terminal cleavage/methylation domain-containing protein
MSSSKQVRRRQKGFSLIELMTVVVILMLVTGVVFQQIDLVQKKGRQEDVKMDLTQESREFLDQMVRDLHTSGYPNKRMYMTNLVNNNDSRTAVGMVVVTPSGLVFEGDVDGDGQVDSIQYQLQSNGGFCPCTIRRSQVVKVNGTEPWNQATNFNMEVNNVVNSGNAFPIAGNSLLASGTVANDVLYGAYKAEPIFQAYDANGNLMALPLDLKNNPTVMSTIRTIRVTINVLAGPEGTDFDTRMRPAVSMTAAARLNN